MASFSLVFNESMYSFRIGSNYSM